MWFEDDPYPSLDDAGRNTISNQIGCSLAAHPVIKSLAVAQQNARNLSPFAFALEFYPVHTNEGFQLNILPSGESLQHVERHKKDVFSALQLTLFDQVPPACQQGSTKGIEGPDHVELRRLTHPAQCANTMDRHLEQPRTDCAPSRVAYFFDVFMGLLCAFGSAFLEQTIRGQIGIRYL